MNGVASVQNPIRASIESLFNLLFIRGDQYDTLSEYYQTFENRRMTAETLGTLFASEGLRDLVIEEYNNKKQTTSDVYKRLLDWQTTCAANHRSMTEDMWVERAVKIADGQLFLHEKMSAVIFLERSGSKYEPYRQELNNDYGKGLDSFGDSIQEQHSNMEFWKPVYVMKETKKATAFVQEGKKETSKETSGTQHYTGNGKPFTGNCFRCERPGCLFYKCTQEKKADGTDVNDKAYIEKKLAEVKKKGEERRAVWNKSDASYGDTGGSQHFIGGEVVPTFEEAIASEDDDEGWTTSYAFTSQEINIDLRTTNHAFNQSKISTKLSRFDVLNDNQSTSNIIIERSFVRNIRPCKWTLVLRTQAGVCRIDQIADLPGVGTVWFYQDGVANILSLHKLIVDSG